MQYESGQLARPERKKAFKHYGTMSTECRNKCEGTQGPYLGQAENQEINNDGLRHTAYLKNHELGCKEYKGLLALVVMM